MITGELKNTKSQLLDCSANSPKIYEIYDSKTGKVYSYIIEDKGGKENRSYIDVGGYKVANIPTIVSILAICSMYLPLTINTEAIMDYVAHLSRVHIALLRGGDDNRDEGN
jgi:hypothetical protein